MPSFKETVKPWFETGDYPTQAQFWQMYEYMMWKDELIPFNQLSIELQTTINNLAAPIEIVVTVAADHVYTIPAGSILEDIILKPVADCSPYCEFQGGAPGGIVPQDPGTILTPEFGDVWTVKKQAIAAPRNIVVKGLPIGSTIVFIKRKTTL